ncbi:MAG: NAD-dependent dihydropyrimidine dehydrogenase subunit PreA [Anaerolineales bacterium]
MASLETTLMGIKFPNPFLLAAGPPSATGAMVVEAFKAGWGGVVLKTIALEPTKHPSPRVQVIKTGRHKRGMIDIELFSEMTLDQWSEELDLIRDSYPRRPIIASITGGGHPEEWQKVVQQLEKHGVNGYEMNVSCPNFSDGERGEKLGQDSKALKLAVSWVREATDLPVIVKLTPNADIAEQATTAAEAGANGVTTINSLTGLAGINIDTLSPLPTVGGIGIFGGYGGPALKPVALRCTAQAAQVAQDLPIQIFGCGGVEKWQDAVEYFAVGASVVEICTAVMWNGFQIIDKLTSGLAEYLEGKGYDSPAEIKGKALPKIGSFPDINLSIQLLASINEDVCNGCGICVTACDSGGFQAIRINENLAQIDLLRCDGCGLCVGVCPLDAIELVPK